jgi:hypothetical protein
MSSSSSLSWEEISQALELNDFAGMPHLRGFRLPTGGTYAHDDVYAGEREFHSTPCTDANAHYWPTIMRSGTNCRVYWYCNTGREGATVTRLRMPLRLDHRAAGE